MTKVNKKDDVKKEVTLFNQERVELMSRINFDADMVSLTDLWKEAGSFPKKRPIDWIGRESTTELIDSMCDILNTPKMGLLKVKRGKTGGGTWAHKNIALAYAKWLDPKLHVLVNEIFFQRVEEEKNPELIVDRAISTYKRKGKSENWIKARIDGKLKRNVFTSCLAKHGVESPDGFKKCTNAIYKPLYGGGTDIIRKKKDLPDKAKIRDNMSSIELAAVSFAEALAQENIEMKRLHGENQCEVECQNSAKIVAKAVVDSRKPVGVF